MNQFTEGGHIVPVKTDQDWVSSQEWMIYIVIARTRQDLYAGRVQNLHNPRWWMEHTWSCKGHPADPKATVALWPVFFGGTMAWIRVGWWRSLRCLAEFAGFWGKLCYIHLWTKWDSGRIQAEQGWSEVVFPWETREKPRGLKRHSSFLEDRPTQ